MATDNQTSIILTAKDETKAAFESVERSLGSLNSLAAALPGSLGGAITGALGAGTFTAIVNGSIDAMAKLHDLSIQSGATVESLSGMKLAAKLAGVEMDDVAKMAQKLGIALGEARLKGGDKAKLFEALGIDPKTTTDTGQALFELAKKLDGMADKTKALAAARELLGKGASLVFLNELAQQEQLIAKVTTAQARLADDFKDNMVKLRAGAGQIGMALANEILPPLNDVVKFSLRVKEEWGAIAGILVGLGGGGALKLLGVELDVARRATAETAEAFKDLAKAREALENKKAGAAQNSIIPGVNDLRAAIVRSAEKDVQEAERRLSAAIAAERKIQSAAAAESAAAKRKNAGANLSDNLLGPGTKDKFDAYEEFIRLAKLAEAEWADIIKVRIERQKEANKDFDDALAAQDRLLDADRSLIKSTREHTEATSLQLELYGQSNAVIQARVKMLDFERIGIERGTQAWQDRYDLELRNSEATEALKKLNDETKKGDEFARSMGLTFTSAFEDAVIGGKKASEVVKALGQDIARIFIRKAVTEPVGGFFADMFKGLFGGGRAAGGPVYPGQYYVVGEHGPEVLVPNTAGTVIPNGGAAQNAGGAISVQVVNNGTPQTVRGVQRSADPQGTVVKIILDDLARNGPIRQKLGALGVA